MDGYDVIIKTHAIKSKYGDKVGSGYLEVLGKKKKYIPFIWFTDSESPFANIMIIGNSPTDIDWIGLMIYRLDEGNGHK